MTAGRRCVLPNIGGAIDKRTEAVRSRSTAIRSKFDGRPLLLTTPGSVNWITGGLSDPIDLTASTDAIWVVETDRDRTLVTNEIEEPRIRDEFDLDALGWSLVAVPWFDAHARVAAAENIAGIKIGGFISDRCDLGTSATAAIVAERMVLTHPEQEAIRALGSLVGRALGAGIDEWKPGVSTDFDVAAAITSELESRGAHAVCLIAGGDERLRRFRHPLAAGSVISEAIMAVVVARAGGLHAAATRIAVVRDDDPILCMVEKIATVDDIMLEASRPRGTWGDAFDALARSYDVIGRPGAWREHFQGGPIAYEQREFELTPGQSSSPFWDVPRSVGTAVAWNPSIAGGAKIEETQLVNADGFELLTRTDGWPMADAAGGTTQRSRVKVIA